MPGLPVSSAVRSVDVALVHNLHVKRSSGGFQDPMANSMYGSSLGNTSANEALSQGSFLPRSLPSGPRPMDSMSHSAELRTKKFPSATTQRFIDSRRPNECAILPNTHCQIRQPFLHTPAPTIHARQLSDPFLDTHPQRALNHAQPIPPQSLPIVRGRLTHTPEVRQKLNEQKVQREIWIRTEAKKIADLNRAKAAAEQQYRLTGSQEDLKAWECAIVAFNDSIDLDKRQEERRNLFLPESMRALRVGRDSLPSDGHSAFGTATSAGQSPLLGYQMALMERLGAEVVTKEEERT